jgi:hypothetical protein
MPTARRFAQHLGRRSITTAVFAAAAAVGEQQKTRRALRLQQKSGQSTIDRHLERLWLSGRDVAHARSSSVPLWWHCYRDLSALTSETILLRTACFIVIGFFSGIRDSEILSLEEGCLVSDTDVDGEAMLWLHRILYKSADNIKGRPVRWLVPPVVARAVGVLEHLTSPLCRQLKEEEEALVAQLSEAQPEGV